MRIGLIVDGFAEREALPHAIRRLTLDHEIVTPVLYADMQPSAPTGRIAREIVSRLKQLGAQGVQRAVALIDAEGYQRCPGSWATEIREDALRIGRGCNGVELFVVAKQKTFENWLVSDPDALRAMPGRFALSGADLASISPDKADRADAVRIMTRCVRGTYRKREDAVRIMRQIDLLRGARNSRSLRRLLRVIGHGMYQEQSRFPGR